MGEKLSPRAPEACFSTGGTALFLGVSLVQMARPRQMQVIVLTMIQRSAHLLRALISLF
jgi:hypothetical protein